LGHVLHLEGSQIARHLVMCSRPRAVPLPELSMPLAGVISRRGHPRGGASGSVVESVKTGSGRFVVKHCGPDRDWIMRATHDTGREAILFREGVLADLPPSILVPIVDAEPEGDGWVIVMQDVRDHFPQDGRKRQRPRRRP